MNPGIELDSLIAKKVMGWEVHPRNTAHYATKPIGKPGDDYGPRFIDEWKPSKNIAHAWEVVEKLAKDDHDKVMIVIRYDDGARAAYLHYRDPIIPDDAARADTAAMAICLAALLAVSGGQSNAVDNGPPPAL